MTFGPFRAGVPEVERIAELRALGAISALLLGSRHPIVAALRQAEVVPESAGVALEQIEQLPASKRRRLLATFSAVCWPDRARHSHVTVSLP